MCYQNSLFRGPLLTAVEADRLDDAEKARNKDLQRAGRRRHYVQQLVVTLQGPVLPILLGPGQHSAHHPLGRGHNY